MNIKSRVGALLGTLLLAVAMVIGLFPASALAAAGDQTVDDTITVTGLDEGDTAKYYQVLSYDSDNGTWVLEGGPYSYTYTNDDDEEVTVNISTAAELLEDVKANGGISAALAGAIAATLPDSDSGTAMDVSEGTATATVAANPLEEMDDDLPGPGLFLVLVTPAQPETIYAPVFVAADFSQETTSPAEIDISIEDGELTSETELPAPPVAVAKKSTLDVVKTAVDSTIDNEDPESTQSVAVGSVIDFKVETNVPSYTSNVQNATFTISDSVSNGLEIQTDSLEIAVGSGAAQSVEEGGYYNVDGSAATEDDYDFTVTALSATAWKIEFSADYLQTEATGAPAVVVTYKAEVTEEAATTNVNEMINTVEIEYTHTPDGDTEKQDDETRHYTYSLDAPLVGHEQDGEKSDELFKIGVEEDGTKVFEHRELVTEGDTKDTPLEGAVFELRGVTNEEVYTATSDADGRIRFDGLDAGEYILVETQAPKGYQLDSTQYLVEITPDFNDDGTLNSYEVTISVLDEEGEVEAGPYTIGSYTIEFDDDGEMSVVDKGTDDIPALFENRKTPALPTTGGAGTLALTMGGVFFIAAGLVIVMRATRRFETE